MLQCCKQVWMPCYVVIANSERTVRKSWDPATASGKLGRAAELRLEDVAPDERGQITIRLAAVGEQDAILQGIEIE